eukprot:1897634-Prymnesium_polylepis.1
MCIRDSAHPARVPRPQFAPAARQPALCAYETTGCTSVTALNYNGRATRDDGSCIEPVRGCTLRPGGDGGQGGLFVGVPLRGRQPVGASAPATLNYNPAANVNEGWCAARGR